MDGRSVRGKALTALPASSRVQTDRRGFGMAASDRWKLQKAYHVLIRQSCLSTHLLFHVKQNLSFSGCA
jgi:hypothetical protein